MGDGSRDTRSFEDSHSRNLNGSGQRRFSYSNPSERDYSSQWQSRQHSMPSDYRWQSGQASYGPPQSVGYYADERDAYTAPPVWGPDRSYYDEPPPARPRNAPPSPIYSHGPPVDPSYRASDDRMRSSSWDPRGGMPRSPPRRSWSDGRHADMMKDEGYDYPPRPFDVGYSKEPRGHYSGPPDLRRSIPPADGYDDRPHYAPGPDVPPYRPNQRLNDPWRNSERVPEGSRLGASGPRGTTDGHAAPRRTPSSYERPPELAMNRYPQEYANSDHRSPASRRGASRSSSLDVTDEFGRAVPQRARPSSPRFGSQSSRTEEHDEFGRIIPQRSFPPRENSPRPPGDSPRVGPSVVAKEEPDEFGRARRNNVVVNLDRPRTPPMPVKAEPSSYPPSPSEGSVPRPRLSDPNHSPSPARRSYNIHSRAPSGSQVRPSQLHNPSSLPSTSNNPQPKHALPTTILPPPIPSIQPAQPVRGEAEISTTAPPISSPFVTQVRDAGPLPAILRTPATMEPIRLASSEVSAKQINIMAPETSQAWHEKDASWRVSVAPPVAPPSVHGIESQNLRWTTNQSPPPNKVITHMGGPSNANRENASPRKQFQSSDGHFGQFRGDASIKLEDVMPSLSRHFGDSNSYNTTIEEVLNRNRELVVDPGAQVHKNGGSKTEEEVMLTVAIPSNHFLATLMARFSHEPPSSSVIDAILEQNILLAERAPLPSLQNIHMDIDIPLHPTTHSDAADIIDQTDHSVHTNPPAPSEASAQNIRAPVQTGDASLDSDGRKDVSALKSSIILEAPESFVKHNSEGIVPATHSSLPPIPSIVGIAPPISSTPTMEQQIDSAPQNQLMKFTPSVEAAMGLVAQYLDSTVSDREAIEEVITENRAKVPKIEWQETSDIVAEQERLHGQEDERLYQEMEPQLHERLAVDMASLEQKNATLMQEYKSCHESWILHRQRLERLEAVRARKQGLLGGDEASNRSGRRGAISLGDAARSDLELDQIMASLVNEDLTNPEILSRKNIAIIPDMLAVTDPRFLEFQYDDRNGLVLDPETFTQELHDAGVWTFEQEQLFVQAYLNSPKQFGRIAAQIPHKTAEQCVLYYYLHKKRINFKGLISKQGPRKGRRGGRRAKAKGNALLKDLRDVVDEDDSAVDSSPTPENTGGTSESDHNATATATTTITTRKKPQNGRVASLRPEATESEDDNYSEDNDGGSPAPLVFIEHEEGTPKKKPRVDPAASGDSAPSGRGRGRGRGRGNGATYWNAQDKGAFLRLLPIHGKNWAVISENIPGKTPLQVRNYFQNHSVELGLPAIAARAEKPPRGAGNPHKHLKTGSNTPGVASPLSKVLALGEDTMLNEHSWVAQPNPAFPNLPGLHSAPENTHPTTLPSIGEFMRNVQSHLASDSWREQHQMPPAVPEPPKTSTTSDQTPSSHIQRPW